MYFVRTTTIRQKRRNEIRTSPAVMVGRITISDVVAIVGGVVVDIEHVELASVPAVVLAVPS